MGPFNRTLHLHKLVKLLPSCPPHPIFSRADASWNVSVPSDTQPQPKERGRNTQQSSKSDISLPLGRMRLLWKQHCPLWAEVLSWPPSFLPSANSPPPWGVGQEVKKGQEQENSCETPFLHSRLLSLLIAVATGHIPFSEATTNMGKGHQGCQEDRGSSLPLLLRAFPLLQCGVSMGHRDYPLCHGPLPRSATTLAEWLSCALQ